MYIGRRRKKWNIERSRVAGKVSYRDVFISFWVTRARQIEGAVESEATGGAVRCPNMKMMDGARSRRRRSRDLGEGARRGWRKGRKKPPGR